MIHNPIPEGVNAVVRREDAAVAEIEPGAVHSEFVVDHDSIVVLALPQDTNVTTNAKAIDDNARYRMAISLPP
jgi:hypothetical protein